MEIDYKTYYTRSVSFSRVLSIFYSNDWLGNIFSACFSQYCGRSGTVMDKNEEFGFYCEQSRIFGK